MTRPIPLKSETDHIVWPALQGLYGSHLQSMLFQLEQTQWWPLEELVRHQLWQLQDLLRYAARSVPYYQRIFREAGFDPGEPLTLRHFRQLPLLRREDMQNHEVDLKGRAVPLAHGDVGPATTSGSTGASVTIYKTELADRLMWGVFALREHLWHRRDMRGKLAAIRYAQQGQSMPPKGDKVRDWGGPAAQIYPTGPAVKLAIRSDPSEQADWLVRNDPDYLLTYPTNLMPLADEFERRGLRLERLKDIRTVSEAFPEGLRERCAEVFGVPIIDTYSTQEAGYIAIQCPDHEHYHVQSENTLVEVLDDEGRPCEPGQIGRVIVTVLHNYATVMLRYDVGDYAEVGPPCPCGRGLPVLKRVMGRVRNLLVYPDGRRSWINFVNFKKNRDVAPVRQAQLVQTSLDAIEVRLVVERDVTADEERQLREMILEDVKHPFELTFSYHDQLLREANGKFEDFKSLVGSAGTPAASA